MPPRRYAGHVYTPAMLRRLAQRLNKPEYFFRPAQLLKRLSRPRWLNGTAERELLLPWGLKLRVHPRENIGLSVLHLGIYDLVVTETLHRLIDPGEHVADVGANLGYMTSLMARRVGRHGRVVSFEPHPLLFTRLQENIARWRDVPDLGTVTPVRAAVADRVAEGQLVVPAGFESNNGLSFVATDAVADARERIRIQLTTLDAHFSDAPAPAVVKIDTEGNEASVFAGADRLLTSEQGIRDIVFEDHGAYPTPAMRRVEERGYTLFQLRKEFTGPGLADARQALPEGMWEPTSYLATRDATRARLRLSVSGWKCLRG
ncbi:FkbM family methyltransferase [Pyxidicoccus xibeiensis]|uniref:FkbM family methyltransferase n=1 Tax=Pyxidicoccus xibeiensis TaxID=2906759 RepID=UPI0020A830A5|nr:FkbM family methyltransferase [Pyxidicoccus xibeiensis]MCP3144181.1 FkbM family methyltransferase [Pyxidicoccus xibeiensis]